MLIYSWRYEEGAVEYAILEAQRSCAVRQLYPRTGKRLTAFSHSRRTLGLRLSWQKTKVQNLGTGDDVGDVTLWQYLRSDCWRRIQVYLPRVPAVLHGQMHRGGSQTNRIASSAMNSMQRVWRYQTLSTETKFRLYRVCFLSILLYGSECWTLRLPQKDLLRLEAFHTRSHRQILGLSSFISSAMTKFWIPLDSLIYRR